MKKVSRLIREMGYIGLFNLQIDLPIYPIFLRLIWIYGKENKMG